MSGSPDTPILTSEFPEDLSHFSFEPVEIATPVEPITYNDLAIQAWNKYSELSRDQKFLKGLDLLKQSLEFYKKFKKSLEDLPKNSRTDQLIKANSKDISSVEAEIINLHSRLAKFLSYIDNPVCLPTPSLEPEKIKLMPDPFERRPQKFSDIFCSLRPHLEDIIESDIPKKEKQNLYLQASKLLIKTKKDSLTSELRPSELKELTDLFSSACEAIHPLRNRVIKDAKASVSALLENLSARARCEASPKAIKTSSKKTAAISSPKPSKTPLEETLTYQQATDLWNQFTALGPNPKKIEATPLLMAVLNLYEDLYEQSKKKKNLMAQKFSQLLLKDIEETKKQLALLEKKPKKEKCKKRSFPVAQELSFEEGIVDLFEKLTKGNPLQISSVLQEIQTFIQDDFSAVEFIFSQPIHVNTLIEFSSSFDQDLASLAINTLSKAIIQLGVEGKTIYDSEKMTRLMQDHSHNKKFSRQCKFNIQRALSVLAPTTLPPMDIPPSWENPLPKDAPPFSDMTAAPLLSSRFSSEAGTSPEDGNPASYKRSKNAFTFLTTCLLGGAEPPPESPELPESPKSPESEELPQPSKN